MTDHPYRFPDLPLSAIRAGTTVLVSGPAHEGARELALTMVADADPADEAAIFITTNDSAPRLMADCERVCGSFRQCRTGVVDCVGEDTESAANRTVLSVSGPGDLTGIGMRFSKLVQAFRRTDGTDIRTGLVSLTTLLSLVDFPQASRFTHALTGHVDVVDGLGVLLVDPSALDDRVVNTISQFCDGRIDVREGDAGPELRSRGLRDQPRDWTVFDGFD